ncbi:PssD/Cps14F family polysaccharide biosynthesis glycosyltransferase [Aeromonas caviae]|uniref:PssD/Cps14F family polysaccharide biosynthesis glycosyltransferase n=1 Tax=Aeromonas caviae TaxID=648 RepID=UPI003EC7F801
MNRLLTRLKPMLCGYQLVSLTDVQTMPSWSDEHCITGEFRGKYNHLEFLTNSGPFKIIYHLIGLIKKYKFRAVITTGPGVGIISSIILKFFGSKVIHVETWSRFNTYSFTGRVMYKIADKFYVQNKSLLKLYPKAIYSGKL